jgi:porin
MNYQIVGVTTAFMLFATGGLVANDRTDDQDAYKIGYSTRSIWGGPNSPEGQLEEMDRIREPAFHFPSIYDPFEPWRDWKRRLNDEQGIEFNGHYSTLVQNLSESLTEDDKASGGVLRAVGKWTLVGRGTPDTGSLLVMVDHRHGFRNVAPADLGSQAGYIGITGSLYSDVDFVVVNLNWQQAFNGKSTGLLVGRYDPNDYMNIQGYENPWTGFSNLAILLDASIAFPDAGWGVAAGQLISDQWYINGGFNDANGKVDDNLDFFDGGGELFKYAEIGWAHSRDKRYEKHANLTVWHVDERDDASIDSAHGLALGGVWTFDDRWKIFLKLGLSDGGAPIYNKSATVGLIRDFLVRSDSFGIAVNWGEPPDNTLREQTTVEAFWRFQFAPNLAIMPSLQLLLDPALNPADDEVWVFGLRFRLTI